MSDHIDELLEELEQATELVQSRLSYTPVLGVVAGSGLGALTSVLTDTTVIPYGDIPNMPGTSVVGHAGELVLGKLEGLPTVVLSGRVHGYEGWASKDLVFGVRLLARLGVQAVLLTNAAGGIRPEMVPGTLCLITDHINFTGLNPLVGRNVASLGPRFPDMSRVYSTALGERLRQAAREVGVALEQGVYAAMRGPSYETPAEIHFLSVVGASVVGMSTVPEAIALRHMGVAVVGISVVSNHAAGVTTALLDHDDVKQIANEAGPRLLTLLGRFAHHLQTSGFP